MRVLHVGSGGASLPEWLVSGLGEVEETTMDIDPDTGPDVVASMTDMGEVGGFDATGCFHALEHLSPHEIPAALGEFYRVLRPGGLAFFVVPDLDGVSPTDEVLGDSPAGPITGHDLFYGHAKQLEGRPYMHHKSGFVEATLRKALERAGFVRIVTERAGGYNLLAAAQRPL